MGIAAINTEEQKAQVRWFVMRAYKNERQAADWLTEEGLEHFIPMCYAVRVYHGVKSRKLVPAIPSLIFVHARQSDIAAFKKHFNQLQFVTWQDKVAGLEYLTVPDDEMENFIRVASRYDDNPIYLKPDEVNLKRGMRVRILGGGLDGVTGVFVRIKGKGKRNRRLVVMLDGIMAIAAEVQPDLIEVLP